MTRRDEPTGLALYDRTARVSSAVVIREYSTSFGLASRLLGREVRDDVGSIYALVRVADEIVDGAAEQAQLGSEAGLLLDELEQETLTAMRRGYSTNLVVHAFALTARSSGIGPELVTPFFRSMRADLTATEFTAAELADYIYGSAEVVGLMCLRAFLRDDPADEETTAVLVRGARSLGAAFQKVNFLRDLAADVDGLGRRYFPGIDYRNLAEGDKAALVAEIDGDLRAAAASIPLLPESARRAVTAAHDLFARLNERLRRTPAAELLQRRIRVPDALKAWVWLRAACGAAPWRSR